MRLNCFVDALSTPCELLNRSLKYTICRWYFSYASGNCYVARSFFVFIGDKKNGLATLFYKYESPRLLVPTLASGVLICANHLLLYAALESSREFDVIAILIFEAWPILFFYIDSTFRKAHRTISATDYIFSGAAFAGFIVLMAPNISLADWLLLESPMLNTILLAGLGGLAMSINCYMRMKCMDAWSQLSDQYELSLTPLRRAILTEGGVRCVAAPLILTTLFCLVI